MSENKQQYNNASTVRFVIIICLSCALILSIISSVLKEPQLQAKNLYQNKQLLIAARILSYKGLFQVKENGNYVLASFDEATQSLLPSEDPSSPTRGEILTIFQKTIKPMLVNAQGQSFTFSEKNVNYEEYLEKHEKYGYANLPLKLIYFIYSEKTKEDTPIGYVIPISGYGLWDFIYGYLGIEANGDTVLATTWYEQKETPGLGGNISLFSWQKQFYGKKIFQPSADGQTNFARAPLGIKVVKTSVEEELGPSPKSQSAVDGIAGATVTSNGVTAAYRASLAPYRAFLIEAHKRAQ